MSCVWSGTNPGLAAFFGSVPIVSQTNSPASIQKQPFTRLPICRAHVGRMQNGCALATGGSTRNTFRKLFPITLWTRVNGAVRYTAF
jgi:hypothetical protein